MLLKIARISRAAVSFFCAAALYASPPQDNPPAPAAESQQSELETYYANAHPYLNDSLDELTRRIPDLSGVQPSGDQRFLGQILDATGQRVDRFFHSSIDLIAHEDIIEQKLDSRAAVLDILRTSDDYLILRHGSEFLEHFTEYRMDSSGKRLEDIGLSQGYIVTANFALTPLYFSTSLQPESSFRYLGDEKIGSCDTYVVAFAQHPADATLHVAFDQGKQGGAHAVARMLVQGVAWIDKNNFQIIRMRTDLLTPRPEIALNALTTTLTFAEVTLPGANVPLWLPCEVVVDIESEGRRFRNKHHYSDYHSYSVQVKMSPEAASTAPSAEALPLTGLPPEELSAVYEKHFYADAHPYFEDSSNELTKLIPELKKLHPASDQSPLPLILRRTGANADDFFRYVIDLIADEKIQQHRLNGRGSVIASEEVRDNYLILRHPARDQNHEDIVEYRMDTNGNRLEKVGLYRGFLVTFGFALIGNYFSTPFQAESDFRYLGDEKIGSHDTYVVAFAQKPGESTLFVTMAGVNGSKVKMLMQGVAWIDKQSFQIVQMRTDLLAPHPEIHIDRQTTEVTFDKVQLVDLANPLWLPSKVKVFLGFKEVDPTHHISYDFGFRNEHRYSDYRHYNVSVKMLTPQGPS